MIHGIIGHKRQINFLETAIERGKLAHGYLFAGPEGVGKRTVAVSLAKELLAPSSGAIAPPSPARGEGQTEENYFHPDLLEISGKEGIKIEQVRELSYKLSLKPYQAKYKVALIDDADQMSLEAANALLKVLEEPKSYTILILITSNPNRLPKTIVSRTQKIIFGLLRNEELDQLLPKNLSARQKSLIQTFAGGRPGIALKIASDENFMEEIENHENYYQIFSGKSLVDRLLVGAEIADMETPQIRNLLFNWLTRLSSELKQNPNLGMKQKIEQVSASAKYLEANVNAKLLLTNLMINTNASSAT